MLIWGAGGCVMFRKNDGVRVVCFFIRVKRFNIKAINTESYSGVMG